MYGSLQPATTGEWVLPSLLWLCLTTLVYTFLGYPLAVFCLGQLFRRRTGHQPSCEPAVTVVLTVFNEAPRVVPRVQNLLASDYPPGKLDIVIVSDGSTDGTSETVRALNEPRVRVLVQPQRLGKSAGLNAGVAAARGDIIVFADVRQQFSRETICELAGRFADPQIGAVSGELEIASAESNTGAGVDAYWRLEKFIRFHEARRDSCVGCTGAVYAVRKGLCRPIPDDTLLDDVVMPMQIALQGYRVVFEPRAVARDPQSLEPERERIRKRRTLAGNYQMLFRYPSWLLPWRNRLWWALISHKYLRLATPWLLFVLFSTSAAMLDRPLYRKLFLAQCLFYLLAVLGLAFKPRRFFPLSLPAGFVFLNCMALSGLWHYLRQPAAAWEKASDV